MQIQFEPVTRDDALCLAEIRVAAMQASLESVGRFDPTRARERFLATFDPLCCRFIIVDQHRAGCVMVRRETAHLMLEHLYLLPHVQRRGVGSAVLHDIFAQADRLGLPVLVGALRESPANLFYQRHGFTRVREAAWDIYYLRAPQAPAPAR